MKAWVCGLLAVMLAAWCMPPGCHAIPSDEVFNGVGVRVFKTATGESWATDSFIRRIVQPYYGPSYHAVSPVLSVKDVPRAQIIVALPNATQLSVNATNERVARFGLTVTSEPGVGNLSQLEVGVEFDGMGWAPYFRTSIIQGVGLRTMPVLYPGLDKSAVYLDNRTRSSRYLPAEAVQAKITITGVSPPKLGETYNGVERINAIVETLKAKRKGFVHLTNTKYTLPPANASSNTDPELVTKPTFTYPFTPFFKRDAENYALVRFGRFAALAPDNGKENAMADTADGSKLTSGLYMIAPKLFDPTTKKYVAWGADMVEHAWAVQTANLAAGLDLGTDAGDIFGAESKAWYGGRCIAVKNTCQQDLAFETAFAGWTNYTSIKMPAYANKTVYVARASAWQSDRGFRGGLASWVPLTSPGLIDNVVKGGDTSVPFCITCSGSCRMHNLQAIYLRVLNATIIRAPDSMDKSFCVNTDAAKNYSIAAKDDVTVWSNNGAVSWDTYFDAVSNRSATTCDGLSGDGNTFAEATFVGFNYPSPIATGTDQSHLTVEVSCPAKRKLLAMEPHTPRHGAVGNRRLLLV